ncbi:MAG: HPr family phosphocarrier protein [Gammaproteobacteria bacterium]|nr:MAG: HPr family phosphocarrier protein [Gammaproteobacteria bacterium]
MLEKKITIINKLGLHARAAAKLVTCATAFDSDIWLRRDSKKVNGKSILGVMMLAAGKDARLTLIADGDDEDEAIRQLTALILARFDEEE